jgi:uncharacterized Zn-finger protein
MELEKPVVVENTTACCDGGLGALGHPKVYLPIGQEGYVDCPYCGRRFMLQSAVERVAAAKSGSSQPTAASPESPL